MMIQSMTGFGKAQVKTTTDQIEVEIRSLNNRYMDVRVFGLKDMLGVEHEIIAKVKKNFLRGKFDINVKTTSLQKSQQADEKDLIKHYRQLVTTAKKIGLEGSVDMALVLKTLPHKPTRQLSGDQSVSILKSVDKALQALEVSRLLEGQFLSKDIVSRITWMAKEIKKIGKQVKVAPTKKLKDLKAKVSALVDHEKLNQERLELEIALLVEKGDVTEELVRLDGHLGRFGKILKEKNPQNGIGRKLDFLIQEINREVNTIGSKVLEVEITKSVVNLKSELEKIREQVQNIQ